MELFVRPFLSILTASALKRKKTRLATVPITLIYIVGGIIYMKFLRNKKKNTLMTNKKARKGFAVYCSVVLAVVMMLTMSITVFAADNSALTAINNLSDFIFGLIRAIGLILLGFGVVQIGLSLKSHDPSQRANGFLTLAGGVVITFAKEILDLIVGG